MQDNEVPHRAFCILSKKDKKESLDHSDFLDDLICDLAFRAANERLSFLGAGTERSVYWCQDRP